MVKKLRYWKKAVVVGAAGITAGLGFWASQAFYTVKEVIDGDTFVTQENQYVRFDKADAPEMDNCLGKEAKDELTKLILNKKVYIKITYRESERNRLVGAVYTEEGNIQEKMLKKGLATLKGGLKKESYNKASDYARSLSLGVHSSECTQTVNPTNSKCNIKGNVTRENKFYRYPGCQSYLTTIVQLHFGEKWFCTEKEAISAGFKKGGDCH